jgi:hypothetical protein
MNLMTSIATLEIYDLTLPAVLGGCENTMRDLRRLQNHGDNPDARLHDPGSRGYALGTDHAVVLTWLRSLHEGEICELA